MSVNSVAAAIWNDLAQTEKLRTAWAKKVFAMNEEELSAQEDEEYLSMKANGTEHDVASAFLDVRHLLLEHEAITRYCRKHPNLRHALPEVTSVNEAILLAQGDRFLTPPQTKQLRELLQQDWRSKRG